MSNITDSDRLIITCYVSGLRGQAIDRIINLSPELIGKRNAKHSVAADGSLHDHPGVIATLPDGQPLRLYWAVMDTGDIVLAKARLDHQLSLASTHDGISVSDALDNGMISATCLLPPETVRALFPRAKIIALRWSRGWHKAIRDAGHKLWSCHTSSEGAIGKYLRWQADRLGMPQGDWIGIHSALAGDPSMHRKSYMHLEAAELIGHQSILADQADHVVDLDDLFGQQAEQEYLRLVTFLGISDARDQVMPWLRSYEALQWFRS